MIKGKNGFSPLLSLLFFCLLAVGLGAAVFLTQNPVKFFPRAADQSTGIIGLRSNCLNPKTYGARGDGQTDDTSPIKSAINSLSDQGGKICLDPGRYRISDTIDLSRGKSIIFEGSGMGNSVLLWVGGNAPVIRASDKGAKPVTIRDLTITAPADPTQRLDKQAGIVLGPVQDIVNIERVEIVGMAGDAIQHKGNSALVRIVGSSFRRNFFGYAVSATSEAGQGQNLVVDSNSIYNNGGGISINTSQGTTISNNDIEGGAPRFPLLNINASDVYLMGNTLGLYDGASQKDAAVFNGKNIVSIGGTYTIGNSSQRAIHILSQSGKIILNGPQLSAGAKGGGTGILIDPGADSVVILAPMFSNSFSQNLIDQGKNTNKIAAD